MTRFFLRPLDWVAFGQPRPSTAGETHYRGSDLPSPTTFQGIVRTALLVGSGDDLSDRSRAAQEARDRLVGGPSSLLPDWQLHGPFFTEIVNGLACPWVRAPRSLVGTSAEPLLVGPLASLDLEGAPTTLNDLSGSDVPVLCGHPAWNGTKALEGWISPRGLRWVLQGAKGQFNPTGFHAGKLPPFVQSQAIAGIGIDPDTGTAEDGMLFVNEVLRFRDGCGLAGWLNTPISSEFIARSLGDGLASCGWRSRPAILEPLPPLDPDFQHVLDGKHLPETADEAQAFFLVALTPVFCEKAHDRAAIERAIVEHPEWPKDVEICVLAVSTGRTGVLGGLEMASKRPRPNRSCWNAGSTWLFTLRGGDGNTRAEALRALNNTHPLGERNDTSFGYGHTLVGMRPQHVDDDILRRAWQRKEADS